VYRQVIATFFVALATSSVAHDMTPTYFKWEPSHVQGVFKATMNMLNLRSDVEWYEVGVFDAEFQPVQFVSQYRLFRMDHQSRIKFDVYVALPDVGKATYICSKSKLRTNVEKQTMIASRICSKKQ
jgi:hypothetical protein